jgi:hypothetical protein
VRKKFFVDLPQKYCIMVFRFKKLLAKFLSIQSLPPFIFFVLLIDAFCVNLILAILTPLIFHRFIQDVDNLWIAQRCPKS